MTSECPNPPSYNSGHQREERRTRSAWSCVLRCCTGTHQPTVVGISGKREGHAVPGHVFSVTAQVGLAVRLAGRVFVTDLSPVGSISERLKQNIS